MWTIGFIEGINQSQVSIKINSQIKTKFELNHIDSSFKIHEIIGVEFDEVIALSYCIPPFYLTDFHSVKSDDFIVLNICHYSRLKFVIDNNLAVYVHLNSYYGNADVTDCHQDDLRDVANALYCSHDSVIGINMCRDGISDILRTNLLSKIINNDPELDYLLDKYIEDQNIGNSDYYCSNLWNRRIEIERKIVLNHKTDHIIVKNNTGYPDNYLNRLFRIKVITSEYSDIYIQDNIKCSKTPFCAKLELEKDYLTKHFDEVLKVITNLLRETNEIALKYYSKDDHLQYLLKQCVHVRFLYKCRRDDIFKQLSKKVAHTYGITNEYRIKEWWLKEEDESLPDLREYIVQ